MHIVELSGDAGLRVAPQTAELLRTALAEHDQVVIAAGALTDVDITTLQLLVAARKTALAAGKSLRLVAPADGALRKALVKAGFVSPDGRPLTAEGDFWTGTSSHLR